MKAELVEKECRKHQDFVCICRQGKRQHKELWDPAGQQGCSGIQVFCHNFQKPSEKMAS